jgi:hypothetical protein
MPIHRCPRCRAEDISADAHPTRVLDNGRLRPILVCRRCYRAAELELRIASEAASIPYEPMPLRDGLRLLADFYLDRLAAIDDPDALAEEGERRAARAPIEAALDEVRRKLAIVVVRDP